jgi:hypothetical protein
MEFTPGTAERHKDLVAALFPGSPGDYPTLEVMKGRRALGGNAGVKEGKRE